MKRFSVWLECEDREKLESMGKIQGLKTGYLLRRAAKEYIQKYYPSVMLVKKAMAEVDADKKTQKDDTKEIKITSQQKDSLRVGLKARTQIREQKEKRRRREYLR